jgi:hypothetical protein
MAGFRAHGEIYGPRLGRVRPLGPPGLMRAAGSAAAPAVRQPPAKKPKGQAGRPRVEGKRPWEAEGISRRTWERRRKKGQGLDRIEVAQCASISR